MARVRLEFVKIAHLEFVDIARPEFVDIASLLCHMSNAKHMEDTATNTRRCKNLIHTATHTIAVILYIIIYTRAEFGKLCEI